MFGFGGDEMNLPVEVTLRLFEFFLFFKDEEGNELRELLIFMLKRKLPNILAMENDEMFRFVSNCRFVIEFFTNESLFEELVTNFLLPLNEQYMEKDSLRGRGVDHLPALCHLIRSED